MTIYEALEKIGEEETMHAEGIPELLAFVLRQICVQLDVDMKREEELFE